MILISLSLLVRNVRLKDPEESASGDEFVVEDPAGNLREETQTIVSFAQGVQGKESTDESDADADGICDALDILQNAKAYVATRPEYESRYYAGGYPDDGYGVCTDVVGYALLHAGYDLMELVAQDVKDSPASYPKAEDKRIDFRRVVNLQVYFTRHAKSLTLDVRNTEAWQPGDIVVFEGHIGIISDRKNERNVPFVIHHGRVDQDEYEEDILEEREEQIIGHYRVGE
ncbi:MAG: DUF1287 domain-containing protein [Lachnospiraceae bacterium]|nr:DUF1287 domain-containing protein [Lachnospiraceae bacterium]